MPLETDIKKAKHSGKLRFLSMGGDEGVLCPCCKTYHGSYASRYPVTREKLFNHAVIIWCTYCGSGFVPGADSLLGDYYVEDYAAENRGDRGSDPVAYFDDISPESNYVRRVKTHLDLFAKHETEMGAVLDFGSGPGYFLKSAQAREAYAIEPDAQSHKYLAHLGAKLTTVEGLQPDMFDAIEASHVIEHLTLTTLDKTMAALVQSLKPTGKMIIEVPNGGLSYLRLPVRHEPHTLFFTPKGITEVIERHGLKILEAKGRGLEDMPAQMKAIYKRPHDAWLGSARKALTIICRKRTADEQQEWEEDQGF